MAIQEPRKFVTTDQGHADVFNVPIATLYENDQELASQVEEIKSNPEANGVASKKAMEEHVANTDLHVTAAKQAAWNAAQANAEQYTRNYAAPKAHSHAASDLPSSSTQARGIVQLNNSTSSTATDQAATPNAVKTLGDELRQQMVPANNVARARLLLSAAQLNDQKLNSGMYITSEGTGLGLNTSGWHHILQMRHASDDGYAAQIATDYYGNGHMHFRSASGASYGPWTTLRDNRNTIISSAAPSGGSDGDLWFQYV